VLPDRLDHQSLSTVRAILDDFDVGGRLKHIREFIWRGGTLQLRADRSPAGQVLDVSYALTAEWAAPVLQRPPSPVTNGLVSWQRPVLEGRWVRGSHGYELRVGIDLSAPSAIYVRSQRPLSHVPFVGRPPAQVEDALNVELTAYVNAFLSQFLPVPQAAALDIQRLRDLGLAA
jgi:hypothetical protein